MDNRGWWYALGAGCLALLLSTACGEGARKKVDDGHPPVHPGIFSRVEVPVVLTDPTARAEYLAAHWWDRYDFRDSVLLGAEATGRSFAAWLDVINRHAKGAERDSLLVGLLDAASVDTAAYERFVRLAETYLYDPNSPLRNEDAYIAVLRHVDASPRVDPLVKSRYRRQLRLALRNRPGEAATDFTYFTASGETGRLHGTEGEYLLLFFYNPGCAMCRDVREWMEADGTIRQAIGSGTLRVLAVCPDGATEQWLAYRPQLPARWINACVDPQQFRKDETYDLKAIPTLYLLGKDKRVILKDCMDVQAIADTLRNRTNGML